MASTITGLSGATSNASNGIDVGSVVDQLMEVERAPERLMQTQQSTLQSQRSALQDLQSKIASLSSAVDALRDPVGAFTQVSAQSGDTSIFRASANSASSAGMHIVVVNQLASTSTAHSRVMKSASDTFSAGTSFDLTIGNGTPVTVSFDDEHNTLSAAADQINSLNLGVAASVITDANGAQLAIISNTSGAAGQIAISNDSTGLQLAQGNAGQNAQVSIDGIPVESSTNRVSDAIAGLTLNLVSAAPGRAIRLDIARDPSAVQAALQNYVSAFNSIVGVINTQFTYNTVKKTSGVLASDPTVRMLQQQLLTMATRTGGDSETITSLPALGVAMNDNGTLTLDGSKLDDVLTTNFDQVQAFLQTSNTGFAVMAATDLDNMSDTTRSPIATDIQSVDDSIRSIGDQIDTFEIRMAERQKQLTDEYTRIDVMLRQFSATQSQVSSQLAALKTVS